MHLRKPTKDAILIGGGIMSASLGVMLKHLAPESEIAVYEANAGPGLEASNAWNNAGTGHAGICELYLTPRNEANGKVDVGKALAVSAQYERSLQFWAFAVREGLIERPREFINPMPHMSFVRTAEQVAYLRERSSRLAEHHFFRRLEFATDLGQIAEWAPLLVNGRRDGVPVGASRMAAGTEVDFGSLAGKLCAWLGRQPGCELRTRHRVTGMEKTSSGWLVTVRNLETGETHTDEAKFVFIGAGGGSLPLLQMADIPESKGYGGFPVGGQWLVCSNPDVVSQHHAKVYGQAAIGTTPAMALPHLDTRMIAGKRSILFGPFAKMTTRFLGRAGSALDLPRSVRPDNIGTLVHSGIHNLPLVIYMARQSSQGMAARLSTLQSFYPEARAEDWSLSDGGIRVQVIKKRNGRGSLIHFDTEIVSNRERTVSALLGASPGASISADLMYGIIRRCLPHLLESEQARERMEEMLPGAGSDLTNPEHADLHRAAAAGAAKTLWLDESTTTPPPSPNTTAAHYS